MRKLLRLGRLVLVHQLALFFPDVCHFPDPPLVHFVAFSVVYLRMVTIYDVLHLLVASVLQLLVARVLQQLSEDDECYELKLIVYRTHLH